MATNPKKNASSDRRKKLRTPDMEAEKRLRVVSMAVLPPGGSSGDTTLTDMDDGPQRQRSAKAYESKSHFLVNNAKSARLPVIRPHQAGADVSQKQAAPDSVERVSKGRKVKREYPRASKS